LDVSTDDLIGGDIGGELDADLAELSLGQRLTAAHPGEASGLGGTSSSEESDPEDTTAAVHPTKKQKRTGSGNAAGVPAASLARTLIQALHSADSRLLETCLQHSDPGLVANTVRRLPPQLAVPLLNACMERLGRGARGENAKGGGGGASAQRGMGLIKWIKAVLAVHSAHLMTVSWSNFNIFIHRIDLAENDQMPDLVARLSGLHATLTARLMLQESLLTLSGRLDMVISQIEMRASTSPAQITNKAQVPKSAREVERYIEGESEDDEVLAQGDELDVEIEQGDDAGSVEDIELGGDGEDSSDGEDDLSEGGDGFIADSPTAEADDSEDSDEGLSD
jgi:U3 small nucleolar RNA-associated protein 5